MTNIALDYNAISIDTCIFDGTGIALENGVLHQLAQFKESEVQVLISDVVHREVLSHLTNKIKEARSKIHQALKQAQNQIQISEKNIEVAREMLYGKGDDVEIARRRLDKFYDKVGAQIVPCEGYVEVGDLVSRYFNANPPFEKSGDKKNEFPDALALLALERFATENNLKILAVSTDKGWSNFAETSPNVDVRSSLAETISYFQPHNVAQNTISLIELDYTAGNENYILDAIEDEIVDSLDGAEIHVEAASSYYYEEDDVHARYISHEFYCDDDGKPLINIIRADAEHTVIQLIANITCEINASFEFSVWDSIDREYVDIGSTSATTIEEYESEVLVTFKGNLSGDFKVLEIEEIEEIEILEHPTHADFGEVSPHMY